MRSKKLAVIAILAVLLGACGPKEGETKEQSLIAPSEGYRANPGRSA